MLRAVELLAQMHERARKMPNVPPRKIDRPVVLHSAAFSFQTGKTKRADVERALGIAFSYPARGWHTYASKESGAACLLSAFYKDATLVAVELYAPRSDRAPALQPRDLGGFRLEPGGAAIGMRVEALPQILTPASGGPGKVVYDEAFEARFEGGVAYAMARAGVIERLALYAEAADPVA